MPAILGGKPALLEVEAEDVAVAGGLLGRGGHLVEGRGQPARAGRAPELLERARDGACQRRRLRSARRGTQPSRPAVIDGHPARYLADEDLQRACALGAEPAQGRAVVGQKARPDVLAQVVRVLRRAGPPQRAADLGVIAAQQLRPGALLAARARQSELSL